jgi:hypothetical protein
MAAIKTIPDAIRSVTGRTLDNAHSLFSATGIDRLSFTDVIARPPHGDVSAVL